MLMLKLDIANAFDNVRWEYLLEVMHQLVSSKGGET
jgi:hypothetical protein